MGKEIILNIYKTGKFVNGGKPNTFAALKYFLENKDNFFIHYINLKIQKNL